MLSVLRMLLSPFLNVRDMHLCTVVGTANCFVLICTKILVRAVVVENVRGYAYLGAFVSLYGSVDLFDAGRSTQAQPR